jgi:hypothetical protein
MKKKKASSDASPAPSDEDTMRPEYDFSEGVRGVTAARYAECVFRPIMIADSGRT